MKKSVSCAVVAALVINMLVVSFAGGKKAAAESSYGLQDPLVSDIAVWDCVYFGSYYQESSTVKSPIKWRVITVDGIDAWLISDKVLDGQPYNKTDAEVTWETCSLRSWLNDDFYNTAFTEAEKSAILRNTNVINDEGNNTSDNVYILSYKQMGYYGTKDQAGFLSLEGRGNFTKPTWYARNRGVAYDDDNTGVDPSLKKEGLHYWVRCQTCQRYDSSFYYANAESSPTFFTKYLKCTKVAGIRPVIHLDLSRTEQWSFAGAMNSWGDEADDRDELRNVSRKNTTYDVCTPAYNDTYDSVWDCIYFGNYFQSSGLKKGKIKWRVLDMNGDIATCIADEVLDYREEVNSTDTTTWKDSSLRNWLNQDFYKEAFSEEEKGALVMNHGVANHNFIFLRDNLGCETTEDTVYLLSYEELNNPLYGFGVFDRVPGSGCLTERRRVQETPYAASRRNEDEKSAWALRTRTRAANFMGEHILTGVNQFMRVSAGGSFREIEYDSYIQHGIRPVVNIDLSKGNWTHAGTVDSCGNEVPYTEPTETPSAEPSIEPSAEPTEEPTETPAVTPTKEPTQEPAVTPTKEPTQAPTAEPSTEPTKTPAVTSSTEPTQAPTVTPTKEPTQAPALTPSTAPSASPGAVPGSSAAPAPTAGSGLSGDKIPVPALKGSKIKKKTGGIYKEAVYLSWDYNRAAQGYEVLRATGNGSYRVIHNSTDSARISYTDTDVNKGQTYYYKIRAYAKENGKNRFSDYAAINITLSKKLIKPKIAMKRKGSKAIFSFKKAEGTYYETQYRFAGSKKWKKLSAMKGKLKAKIVKKIKGKNFQLRIRTYEKVGKKKYYSKWSKKIRIK